MIRFRFVHVTVALWLYWGIVPLTESCADTEIVVRLDRGEDIGQNFGSLFEGVTQDGAFIVGAGFSGLYNTYHRDDRHVVHFYIRVV